MKFVRRLFGTSPPPITSTVLTGVSPPAADRHGLALVAIMKNEAKDIADWVFFHHLAGVRHFYLYDDGSSDGTPEVAAALAFANVTVIPWKLSSTLLSPRARFSRQVMAYCHAIENFGSAYRWMGFTDIDEYLIPKREKSILDVLATLEAFTSISLPWTMFGPNGRAARDDALPDPYAYTTRAAKREGPLLNFKCIIDPSDAHEVRVHRHRTQTMGRTSASESGLVRHYKQRSDPAFLSDDHLQLNHYYTRSRADLAAKLSKGAVSNSPLDRRNRKVMEKLALIEATEVEDRAALDFLERHGITDPSAFRRARQA